MNSGYPQAYWHTVVRLMINFGVPIPPEQVLPVTDYLAKNLPEKAKPDANILPGPTQVVIREWQVPIPGSRPRRMAYGADGSIYYSDYPRGMLGRLDPQNGRVTEWPSPGGPKSEPYGIVFAKGAIWYSESGTRPNTIVRFDPKARSFQTWAIPSGGYIVRKMDVTPDGNPVIATSTVNGVGLVEVR